MTDGLFERLGNARGIAIFLGGLDVCSHRFEEQADRTTAILGQLAADEVHRLDAVGAFVDLRDARVDIGFSAGAVDNGGVLLADDDPRAQEVMAKYGAEILRLWVTAEDYRASIAGIDVPPDDVPGVIGRVGTYLGNQGINIDNMVVGQSRATGMAAMMGVNMDRALTDDDLREQDITWSPDGSRLAYLAMARAGYEADLVFADGRRESLDTLTVRITEYTEGDNGSEAMPAELPPATAIFSKMATEAQSTTNSEVARE